MDAPTSPPSHQSSDLAAGFSLAIVVLLWLISFSYRQTIHAYPSGGGAYIVAKENLGMYAGLTAAAALLVDYTLTVAVSISSGVAAVTSAAQGSPVAWISANRAPSSRCPPTCSSSAFW